MDERRRLRLQGSILQALGEILSRDVSDGRLDCVSFTKIKLSRDGSHATVFYEVAGDSEQKQEAESAMESAKGYLRSKLSSKVRMRTVPVLSLVMDSSGEEGDRTLDIIRELDSD